MSDMENEKKVLLEESNTVKSLKTLPDTVNAIINAAAEEQRQEVPVEAK